MLGSEVWACDDWAQYRFRCGQRDIVRRLNVERALEEIKEMKQSLRGEENE
jgi:hypothetical protein